MPSSPLLGLDICPEAVKLVELSRHRGRIQLDFADSEALPGGAVTDREVVDVEVVGAAIRSMLRRSHIRTRRAATALPTAAVIVKEISVADDLREDAIEDQIRYEGGQYIPFPMDAVNFDFDERGPDPARRGHKRVVVVASKREDVEDRAAAIEQSGLKAQVVDTKSFALWNLLEHLSDNQATQTGVILIDLGSRSTAIHAFDAGKSVYSREHSFGAGDLGAEISRHYGLSLADAQRMQRYGGLPTDYQDAVLTPFLHKVSRELLHALDFLQSSVVDMHVESAYLFGPGAALPGILGPTQAALPFPVEIPDPFAKMAMGPKVNPRFLQTERSSLAIACGLALRRFFP